MVYVVTIARSGYTAVEANSKKEAEKIAETLRTDQIYWDDDWIVTDADEIPDADHVPYIS